MSWIEIFLFFSKDVLDFHGFLRFDLQYSNLFLSSLLFVHDAMISDEADKRLLNTNLLLVSVKVHIKYNVYWSMSS